MLSTAIGDEAVMRRRSQMTPDEQLRSTWDELVAKVAAAADLGQRNAARERLLTGYGEPHRAYHTTAHIAALLDLLTVHGAAARDPNALRLAILYHDVVYDPRRSDNEAVSANVAQRDLTALNVEAALLARVVQLVLATQHGAHVTDAADTDLALLLDLDLSVLAAAPSDYDAYAAAIRHEYAHVPGLLYRPGRRRVLQKFLDADQLYLTPALQAAWEHRARANLVREIKQLS
jgi:predicted metal-dependent HD superfamily phosphohydrolase